jgi:hypothetical protein
VEIREFDLLLLLTTDYDEGDMRHEIPISITGLGIIFYSPFAVAGIGEGEDYFSSTFQNPANVAAHAMRGDISTFCTGSGGDFSLVAYDGTLDDDGLLNAEFQLRLCLEVRGCDVCFRDVYDLMDWAANCPSPQKIKVADGFYRVTVYSSTPASGIIGNDQLIYLHFEKVGRRPTLKWDGVPQLC